MILWDLKAKALNESNCMQSCKRVSLDLGTFVDATYWAFSELLIDYGWNGWSPLVRESKRRMILQKFVKRCKTDREERHIRQWFDDAWKTKHWRQQVVHSRRIRRIKGAIPLPLMIQLTGLELMMSGDCVLQRRYELDMPVIWSWIGPTFAGSRAASSREALLIN